MADLGRKGDIDVKIVGKEDTGAKKVDVRDDLDSKNRFCVDAYITGEGDDVVDSTYRGKAFIKHLTLNGAEPYTLTNGSMNVDGSSTPKSFYRIPSSGKKWYVTRMKITMEDSSINHTKFGGISALSNGITFKVTENGTERDLYEHSITKNGSFYHLDTSHIIESSNTDIISINIDFYESIGTSLKLLNSTSDNLKIVVNDDLTEVNFIEATIFGYEVDE